MNVSNDEEMWRYVDLEICWIQRFKVFMNGTMMMRFGDVWIKGGFLSSLGVRRQKVVQILKPLLWNRFYWEEDQRNKSFLIRDENIIANSVNRIQTLSSHFHPPVVLKRDILHGWLRAQRTCTLPTNKKGYAGILCTKWFWFEGAFYQCKLRCEILSMQAPMWIEQSRGEQIRRLLHTGLALLVLGSTHRIIKTISIEIEMQIHIYRYKKTMQIQIQK